MLDDGGWVRTFMDEAESQRTHLMAFVALAKPNAWERFLIVLVQGIFYNAYFFLYLISAGTAHRLAAYFAEQAVQGYSKYLSQIESGERAMQPAPALAIAYWALAPDAQVRDMIASMLEDEAIHRDLHHAFADALMQGQTFPDRISSIS
jgi:ubiquinol oxidase